MFWCLSHVSVSSLVAQAVKRLPAMQETWDSIPGSGWYPGEGNGNLLQYSCLKNSTDRGVWSLQSMASQRVRHNWAHACMHTHTRARTLLALRATSCFIQSQQCNGTVRSRSVISLYYVFLLEGIVDRINFPKSEGSPAIHPLSCFVEQYYNTLAF